MDPEETDYKMQWRADAADELKRLEVLAYDLESVLGKTGVVFRISAAISRLRALVSVA